jgi:hypothetical protein
LPLFKLPRVVSDDDDDDDDGDDGGGDEAPGSNVAALKAHAMV